MKKFNIIVMYIAGLFLLVATVMKTHQLVTEPILSKGFWESWEFFLIQIPLELGLAIWLLSGLFRKAVWLLTTVVFFGFIVITLVKAMLGMESCGCFGVVHVDPWVTLFAIDIPVVVLLLIFRPVGCKLLPPPWPKAGHFFAIAIPTFILLPCVELFIILNKPPEKTETYEVVDTAEWTHPKKTDPVVVEPNNVNESNLIVSSVNEPNLVSETPLDLPQWPMLEHIDIAGELKNGIWVVLMYHYDCPDCAEAMPIYDEMYRGIMGNDDVMRFAFVHLPPFDTNGGIGPVPENTVCKLGRINTEKMFYVETPVVVVLLDGSVLGAWEGEAPEFDTLLDTAFSN